MPLVLEEKSRSYHASPQDAPAGGREAARSWRGRRGIPSREVTFLFNQLALILETGSPLTPGLRQVAVQTGHRRFGGLVESLVRELEGGNTFARALALHPGVFSPVEISMIQVGEAGGFLPEMVNRVLELRQRSDELKAALRGAMIYPAVLMTVAIGVVGFMLGFVFPRFAHIFADMEASLPITTRMLMALSGFFLGRWYLILGALVLGAVGGHALSRTRRGAQLWENAKLGLPLAGDVLRQVYLSQLFLNLGSLLKAKVSLMNALTVCRGALSHHAFRALLDQLTCAAERGEGLSGPFTRSSLVPALARGIIATGEETGQLDRAFLRLASFYDDQVRQKVKNLTALLEPALLVFMGGIVGFIVISLVLPIFRMSHGVR